MRPTRSILFASSLAVFGCGGGGGNTSPTTPAISVPVVTTVTVTLASTKFELGSTTTATAIVLDQNGGAINGKTISWSSDNQSVAAVGADGVVTGVAAGTANIVATVDGKQGKAAGTVTTWIYDGTILSNADFGGAAGALADVSVLQLKDGRFRMIIGGFPNSPGGFGSAISSDGVKFTIEPGVRLATPVQVGGVLSSFVKPVAVRMDDGRIRLFATAVSGVPDGIYSFTSSDEGLTFTPDAGARITLAASGLIGVGSVVKTKGGGWRMYFNDNPPSTVGAGGVIVLGSPKTLSATSSDLTNFSVDAGVRVGTGATLSGAAQSAGAVLNADGSTTIVYFRNIPGYALQSTSADGLNFTTEVHAGFGTNERVPIPAIDAYLLTLANGDVRMYFNYGNNVAGTIYTAHHTAFSLK